SDDAGAFFQVSSSDEDAMSQITASLPLSPPAPGALALPPGLLTHSIASPNLDTGILSYAPTGLGPFSSIDVKVIPENIVIVPKIDDRTSHGDASERLLVVRHGETFEQILMANGASADHVKQIQTALAPRTRDYTVTVGQKLRLLVAGSHENHRGDELL